MEGNNPSAEGDGSLVDRLPSRRLLPASVNRGQPPGSGSSRLFAASFAQQVQAAALAIDDQQRSADVEGGGGATAAPPPADEGVCEEAAQLVDSTPWLPAMLRQDSRRRLMGRQDSLALFQVHNCTAPTTAYRCCTAAAVL